MHTLHKFNNNYFYISDKSFIQNKLIQKELRQYVNTLIDNYYHKLVSNTLLSYIVCIGGESYLFGLCNNFKKIIHYTNSNYIYNDANLNSKICKKEITNNLINYSTITHISNGNILILNIAKLNTNLINLCNNRYYNYIIIINCHHNDFWKKFNYLTEYKIVNRRQFIADNYFVTVTVLKYKKELPIFISLGNTCAIAHQLNELGLRTKSFPFDWCKITISQINKVLQNNFKDYNRLRVIRYSNNHKSYLLKNSYNILFAHELTIYNNNRELENNIYNKILNFKNCNNRTIHFILHSPIYNQNEIDLLILNLKQIFTKFKIIYITNLHQYINFIISDCIKVVTIDYNIIDWSDWTLSSIDWISIINDDK